MGTLITLDARDLHALESERLLVVRPDAVFRLEGPGVTDCLQGLLTNDVKAGGEHGLVWGAVLTPKGMIISDLWVRRDGATAAWVIVPASRREVVRTLFQKTLPPRLAKCTDVSDSTAVAWLTGALPESTDLPVSKPHGPAPFSGMVLADSADRLLPYAAAGWRTVSADFAEAQKLLLGWPTIDREIDEKTLVQEVRFDELQGVRYDKGCYTGQETVARLHFRGHPNRQLVGLRWANATQPERGEITVGDKTVGSVTSVARLGNQIVALAVVRREVAIGSEVRIGESSATVVALPFDRPDFQVT